MLRHAMLAAISGAGYARLECRKGEA